MSKNSTPKEQRVVLSNVSWQQFERLPAELGAERIVRLTYSRGKLELMTPVEDHERCRKLIESLILLLVDELSWQVEAIAPILLKRPDLQCATEPDAGYFFQADPVDHSSTPVNLTLPSPGLPDLIVEIALTKSALDKLPIYASLGIQEVWRYVAQAGEILEGSFLIYLLRDGEYTQSVNSAAFPFLPAARALEFITQSDTIGLAKSLTILREWIRENV